jgi:hypothetical protein
MEAAVSIWSPTARVGTSIYHSAHLLAAHDVEDIRKRLKPLEAKSCQRARLSQGASFEEGRGGQEVRASTARVANIVKQAACRPGWRRWRISRRLPDAADSPVSQSCAPPR